tara:strand:+ start:1576 stop:2541 length:966 start_codon:yes stop_codon:yes gene_type:complete
VNKELLETVGLGHFKESDFSAKEVILRSGKSTKVWVHGPTGHGVLDSENWMEDDYYEEDYREEFSGDSKGKNIESERHFKMFRDLNKRQFEQFSEHLDSETSLLEIGCSFGGVVDYVVDFGIRTHHAVEPNKKDALYVREKYQNVKVHNSLLEDAGLAKNSFDIAVSFEVLEHTISPRDFLLKAKDCLKKDGLIHIEVPNHYDVLLSCFKEEINYNTFYYHKAHIHYFTPESLKSLCEECGFSGEVTSFLMYPFFNHVYWLQNQGPQPTATQALSLPLPTEEKTEAQKQINDFFRSAEAEYENLINLHKLGDCIVFQGVKR